MSHVSPEAAAGGEIALIEDGDTIEINIPERKIHLAIAESEMEARRKKQQARGPAAFTPPPRKRRVTEALKAYAGMVSSADKGAVRIIE